MNNIAKVIRWNLIANKKNIGRAVIGGFIGLFIASLLGTGALWSREAPSEGTVAGISTAFIIIVGFLMLHYAASICWNMKTKTEFLNYAMLPATKQEKFWANWFHTTIVMLIAIFVGVAAADIIQALYTLIFSGAAHSYIFCILNSVFAISEGGTAVFMALLGMVFAHSTFILGGCFFRKHQTLYTALMWVFIPTVLSIIIGVIGSGIMYCISDNNYSVQIEWLLNDWQGSLLSAVVLIALTAFDYWYAFRLFKRMQIINNSLFN